MEQVFQCNQNNFNMQGVSMTAPLNKISSYMMVPNFFCQTLWLKNYCLVRPTQVDETCYGPSCESPDNPNLKTITSQLQVWKLALHAHATNKLRHNTLMLHFPTSDQKNLSVYISHVYFILGIQLNVHWCTFRYSMAKWCTWLW